MQCAISETDLNDEDVEIVDLLYVVSLADAGDVEAVEEPPEICLLYTSDAADE